MPKMKRHPVKHVRRVKHRQHHCRRCGEVIDFDDLYFTHPDEGKLHVQCIGLGEACCRPAREQLENAHKEAFAP